MSYSWKEIALMYKKEANKLCAEVYEAAEEIETNLPRCSIRAKNIMIKAFNGSVDELEFISHFEDLADKPRPVKKTKPVISVKKETNSDKGFLFIPKDWMEEGDYDEVEEICSEIHDPKKKIHEIMDKCAVRCAIKYFKGRNFEILDKVKDNIVTIIDPSTKREATAKIIVSGMEFSGKTKRFGEDGDTFPVDKQYTYLLDPKESVKNVYIFANFDNKDKSLKLYALVKGKHIQNMLVDPLRERFIGKMSCILQRKGYNKSTEVPFAINELIQ